MTREYDDFILYLHVDFVFEVANKYCVKMYFERSWFCILLRNVFLIFVCVLLFGFFFDVDNLCAFYNCLQIEDLNLKFEKKRKTTQKKKKPSKFYDHFNEQISFFKRKEYIFRKNKKWINLSSRQKKSKLPVVILETVSHEPIKNPLSSAPEVSVWVCFFFGINKVAARKSTRKITGKNLNAKLIKKETNLNLKHCLVKVQSLNLTFIYLQG